MAQTITIRREGLTLDLLLFQSYGPSGRDLLEIAFGINPGLADLGPIIPLGTTVTIPDRPVGSALSSRPVVSLFG
ncbi:MAG TPA: tail protein X [Devosia sp.]|jgi:phage tail protein X|nr:tail protein X [Devosia sp.]